MFLLFGFDENSLWKAYYKKRRETSNKKKETTAQYIPNEEYTQVLTAISAADDEV